MEKGPRLLPCHKLMPRARAQTSASICPPQCSGRLLRYQDIDGRRATRLLKCQVSSFLFLLSFNFTARTCFILEFSEPLVMQREAASVPSILLTIRNKANVLSSFISSHFSSATVPILQFSDPPNTLPQRQLTRARLSRYQVFSLRYATRLLSCQVSSQLTFNLSPFPPCYHTILRVLQTPTAKQSGKLPRYQRSYLRRATKSFLCRILHYISSSQVIPRPSVQL